jgi:hypothetical protein
VANGTNGCCSALCQTLDADGDGVCDGHDVCPAVADPAQTDADGDGRGDACDLCRTLSPGQGAWLGAQLVATHVDDGVSSNDNLKLRGQFTLATGTFSIDPLADGVRLEVRGASGLPRLVITLPAGAFVSPGPGWLVGTRGAPRYVFKDRRPGGTGGITSMLVADKGAGAVRVALAAKNTTLALVAADAPLSATVVLGDAAAGECGEVEFPGPSPAPACVVGQLGTRIACR